MTKAHTKQLTFLLIAVVVAGIFFLAEAKRTSGITITPEKIPLVAASLTNIAITPDDYQLGNPGSELVIVEFSDFDCNECKVIHQTLKKFISDRPTAAHLIWKDTTVSGWFKKDTTLAKQAAWCAGKQNKFWPFVDAMFSDSRRLNEAGIIQTAGELGLNTDALLNCAASNEAAVQVAKNQALAVSVSATTQPTVFINNRRINTGTDITLDKMLELFIQK